MNYHGKSALVTGADGFIGSHLAEALCGAGAKVTALAQYNSFDNHGWLDDVSSEAVAAMDVIRGDVRDPAFMLRLAEGRDVIFHLAALIAIPYSYAAPQSYIDTNVTGTLNVLEAARRNGCGRVIHTSTSEVYGTAQFTPITEEHPLRGQSPYSASKIGADMMVEAFARSFDLPVAILRPFNTYGPRQSERAVIPTVIRQALDPSCATVRLGDLTPTRDFNYVSDTVDAFLRLGSADGVAFGTPYNAGTGTAVSVGEMVELVRAITGTNKPVETDADRVRPEKSEVRALIADAARIGEATGWRPQITLQDGLERTVIWWQGQIETGAMRAQAGYMT